MKKSMCCNADMIYLGKNYHPNVLIIFEGPNYIYLCSECGRAEWSSDKERCKYKWYKYSKEELINLIKKSEVKIYDGNESIKSTNSNNYKPNVSDL